MANILSKNNNNLLERLKEKAVLNRRMHIRYEFEKEIQFRSMSLSYGKTLFDIKPEELEDYFTTNKFVKFDSITKKLTTHKIEGKHNPMIFVRRKILDSIQNID